MSRRSRALLIGLGLAVACLDGCKDEDTNLPFTFVAQPASPVIGTTPIFFTLTTDGSQATVAVDVSADDGLTFKKATEVGGQSNPGVLQGSPEGTNQFFNWDPLADLGPGIHRRVIIRVAGQGSSFGIFTQTAPFLVDLTDRLSSLAAGPAPLLSRPFALPLPDGTVWLTGGSTAGQLNVLGYRYDPVTDALTVTTPLGQPRSRAGGALLSGGQALAVGGFDAGGTPVAFAESLRVNSSGVQLVSEASLQVARGAPAVAALGDGRALIVGGELTGAVSTPAVEVLTPGAASTALAFNDATLVRRELTATSLLDGRVLVVGGFDDAGDPVARPTLIDAAATAATPTNGGLGNPRGEHAAVRLPDGRVVILGGTARLGDDSAALSSVEVFDPDSNSLTPLPSMSRTRRNPGAVYAGGGLVVFGGSGSTDAPTTAERFDLETLVWSQIAGPSGVSRPAAVAVASGNGRALVAGGDQAPERYTPDASLAAESFSALDAIPQPRADHTATLLSSGEVLLVGGTAGISSAVATVEAANFDATTFEARRSMNRARASHAAVQVGSQLLVVGGRDANGLVVEAEVYDVTFDSWSSAGTLNTPRADLTATLLGDGTVLVAGGVDAAGNPVAQLERWNPQTKTFTVSGALTTGRADHDAIRVGAGNALIGPGQGTAGAVADLDLVVFSFGAPFRLSSGTARAGAALAEVPLGSGLVAITGGVDANGTRGDLDVIDARLAPPVYSAQGRALQVPRSRHLAVSLANGRSVLLIGGLNARGGATDEHEIYETDPFGTQASGSTRRVLDRRGHRARVRHTATRLIDGRVLIVGGVDERGVVIAGAEVFDP